LPYDEHKRNTAPTNQEKPVNTTQQRAADIAAQLDTLYQDTDARPQHIADLFAQLEAAAEPETPHTLRKADSLAVIYRTIYTEAKLNTPERAGVVVAIVAHRNEDHSTGTVTFDIIPGHDTRAVWPHMSYTPSFWTGGTFAPLPDGARRLIVDHIAARLTPLIEQNAAALVAAAHEERARYETLRILGSARRALDDVTRGIER
jgi:hypothetical protein